MKKRVFVLIIAVVLLLSMASCSSKATEVNFGTFRGTFSPFFLRDMQDLSVVGAVFDSLLVADSEGKFIYDAYTQGIGIADITVSNDGANTVCTVQVGKDIYFSDGVQLTAKDVAYSMYVYADLEYDGWSYFSTSPVEGLLNYRYGTTYVSGVDAGIERIEEELANPSERTQELIREKLFKTVLRAEYDWVVSLYNDPAYIGTAAEKHIKDYPEPNELLAFYYSLDPEFTGKGVTDVEELIDILARQYGTDYIKLSEAYGYDLQDPAEQLAKRAIIERGLEGKPASPVNTISGITKVDEFTLKVTINGVGDELISDVLGIYVVPFHYYGTEGADKNWNENIPCNFDVDLEKVAEKDSAPLGSGRYVFKEYKKGEYVDFTKNKYYTRKGELESKLRFNETGDSSNQDAEYFVTYENRLYVEN